MVLFGIIIAWALAIVGGGWMFASEIKYWWTGGEYVYSTTRGQGPRHLRTESEG